MSTTTQDRRTREDLRVELARTTRELDDATAARRESAEAHAKERTARDAEAVAIEACARALRVIEPADRSGINDYMASTYRTSSRDQDTRRSDGTSVERVLGYLRQRFGLPDPTSEVQELRRLADEAQQRAYSLEQQLQSIRMSVEGVR